MKRAVFIGVVLTGLSMHAQSITGPMVPAITPPTSPVMVPGGLATSLDSTGAETNVAPVNPTFNIPTLSALLTNLESAVTQALPVLNAFNDGFNSFVLDSSGTTTGVGSADNFITDLTTTNLFSNPGSTQGGSYAGGPGSTANVSGGPVNVFGQPIGATTMPVTRETLRALLVLQNDLERILPLLDTLNTGTNSTSISLTPGFVPGNFTNTFGGTATGF